MKIDSRLSSLYLFIIWFILGILLTISFYAHRRIEAFPATPRKKILIATIKDLEKERNSLKKELVDLRLKLSEYEKMAAADEGVLNSFSRKLNSLELAAGLAAIQGPGISVTLGDSPSVPPNKNPNDYIIHDTDVRLLVNTLWLAGAEAISVNGQRLVSSTAIRCAGNTVLVNSTRLATPYVIQAIGKPELLAQALKKDKEASRLLNDYAKAYNLFASVQEVSQLKIPAYKGSLTVQYAKPVKGE